MWLESSDSIVFSKGTDFKYILNNIKNSKFDIAESYIRSLFELAVEFGKT